MRSRQRGSTTVELAFVLLTFFMFLLGILDFSRMLYTWNAATEATRLGARYAVVCAKTENDGRVLGKMRAWVPEIGGVALNLERAPCGGASCDVVAVTVTITSLNFRWLSPVTGVVMTPIAMPSFSTRLPREMLGQDPNDALICQ